jgi:hypothetical protein
VRPCWRRHRKIALDGINRTTPVSTRRRENEDSGEDARRVRPRPQATGTAGPAGLVGRASPQAPPSSSVPRRQAPPPAAADLQRPQWSSQSDTGFPFGSPTPSQGAADSEHVFHQWLATGASPLAAAAGASTPAHPRLHGHWPSHSLSASVSGHQRVDAIDEVLSTHAPAASAYAPVNAGQTSPAAPMSAEQAVQWYGRRLGDLRLIEDAYPFICDEFGQDENRTSVASRSLHRFAAHLANGDAHSTLQRFISHLGSASPMVRQQAQAQLDDFMRSEPSHRTGNLREGVATLANIPGEEINALLEDGDWSHADVNHKYLNWLVPEQDKALLERPGLLASDGDELKPFGLALLHAGHGGLTEWLQMCNDGRGEQARALMVRHVRDTQVARLPHILDRLQASDGMASERRVGVKQTRTAVVGEHREPLPVPAPRPARAQLALPGAEADADDHQLRFLCEREARKLSKSKLVPSRHGRELSKFAVFLKGADAQDGLRNFLSRQQSNVESIRHQAAAQLADFIDQAPAGTARTDRRTRTNAALATLSAIPAEQRHLSAADVGQLKPDDQLKLLSTQDQALLQRLRNETAGGALRILQLRAPLIRFAAALIQRGEAGLAGWLAMYHDGRHQQGKRLLESVTGEAGMDSLADAARRLQFLDNVDPANSIRQGHRRQPRSLFPTGFPAAEAALISTAIESMQTRNDDEDEGAVGVADSTAQRRQGHLVGFSNWLRRPPAQGASGHPGGLVDLLALERSGDREAIERLRDEYLIHLGGAPGTMKARRSALKIALSALLRQAGTAPVGPGSAAAQAAGDAATAAPQPGIDGAGDLDNLSLSSLVSLPLDPLLATPGDGEVQSRLRNQANLPPPPGSALSPHLDSLWLSSLMSLPPLDSLPATHSDSQVQPRLSSEVVGTPEPMPAARAADSAEEFQRYLAEMSDEVESRARQAPAAPPIDDLLRAMSMLQATRRHGAPMHVGNAASAVGLPSDQLSTFINDEGCLRDTRQVRDWLLELPPNQRDAVLRFSTA